MNALPVMVSILLHAVALAEQEPAIPSEVHVSTRIGALEASIATLAGNGDYDGALDHALLAMEERRSNLPADAAGLARGIAMVGSLHADMEQYRLAIEHLAEAAQVAERAGLNAAATMYDQQAETAALYVHVYSALDDGKPDKALGPMQAIVAARAQRESEAPLALAQANNDLAFVLILNGQCTRGQRLAEAALLTRQDALPAGHPKLAESWLCVAGTAACLGWDAESQAAYVAGVRAWSQGPLSRLREPPSYLAVTKAYPRVTSSAR